MGRTTNELDWIFDAMRAHRDRFPGVRLAICGVDTAAISTQLDGLKDRLDSFGQITAERARTFAAALDLGLLPLLDEPFNRSRFPVKLLDYAGAGAPVLCSDVGEAGIVGRRLPSVLLAGRTKAAWIEAFGDAIGRLMRREVLSLNTAAFKAQWAWPQKALEMIEIYRACLSRKGLRHGRRSAP